MTAASNVASVAVPAGAAVIVAPADPARTYLRLNNSSLSDLTFSISQAAATARKGWRNTGAQADFELDDRLVGELATAEIWCYNAGTVAAEVACIYGYRV